MKEFIRFFAVFFLVVIISACGSDSSSTEETNAAPLTPQLEQPVNGTYSAGLNPVLVWTASDPDGDELVYDVYFGEDPEPAIFAENHTETQLQLNDLEYETRYYWKVKAKDGKDARSSEIWRFNTIAQDQPPQVPYNPIPADNEIDLDIEVNLRWVCSDPDGDLLSFDIYFGMESQLELLAEDYAGYQYRVEDLGYHTDYYWQIIAKSKDLQTSSPLWHFVTKYDNYPPEIPSNPDPADSSLNISTYTQLDWDCSDEEGDVLLYDIYLGTTENPEIFATSHPYSLFDPGNLEGNTQYYWRIQARDEFNYTSGPVWTFTTMEANNPPNEPYMPWPEDGATDEVVEAMIRWSCSDPDGDVVYYKVYFGLTAQLTESHVVALGLTDGLLDLGTLENDTTYYWKINASDGEASVTGPVWNFTTEE